MSTLIVYFSLEGNTKFISEKIAETISADMISLNTSKKYATGGLKKYFWGGKSVVFGEKPELTNEPIELSSYDTIIIGTPVWAGSYAPPIKTFLTQYKIEGKRIALFACHAGGGAEKCFKKIKEAIPKNEFIGEIDFAEPKRNTDDNSARVVKWSESLKL